MGPLYVGWDNPPVTYWFSGHLKKGSQKPTELVGAHIFSRVQKPL